MDWSILQALNGFLAHHDAVEDPSMLYVEASKALFVALIIGLFILGSQRLRRAAVAAAASAGVALAGAMALSIAVGRARPFAAAPSRVHLLLPHAADPGFPSDHATAAFAIATAIVLRDRRYGVMSLLLAGALAVGRVAAGMHFPSDVLVGAVLGAVIALLLSKGPPRQLLDALADTSGQVLDRVAASIPRRAKAPRTSLAGGRATR